MYLPSLIGAVGSDRSPLLPLPLLVLSVLLELLTSLALERQQSISEEVRQDSPWIAMLAISLYVTNYVA